MKKTSYIIAITAAALFSTAGYAGVDDDQDLIHGDVTLASSTSSPYVMKHNGPKGTEQDLIYGAVNINASEAQPYDRARSDRDNRDDMINNV
jgi:hypothetical protein